MSKITITLRAPNQAKDHVLTCEPNWSILKLKQVINETYPGNPDVSSQRLIYGGRYLLDNEIVSSSFKISNYPQIVHLVLSGGGASVSSSQTSTTAPEEFSEASSGLRHRHVPNSSTSSASTNNSQWNQWQQDYNPAHNIYHHHHYATHNHNHMAAMWEQYQQQWNHYMQHYQGQHLANNQNEAAPANEGAQAPAPPQAQPNVADANPPMNAQGGFAAAADDDMGQQDWLDMFFMLFRYVFFFSIIFFYSTFWRFLLVSGLVLVFYIYQAGGFRVQRRRVVIQMEGNQPAQQNDTDSNNNETNENDEGGTPSPNVPPPPSLFATAWCFIQTFFTSLIPQPPPVV